MRPSHYLSLAIAVTFLAFSGCTSSRQPAFRKHVINEQSPYEAAAAMDINNDGQLDIYCGGHWYEAPKWEKHFTRELKEKSGYYDDFAALPVDVDGDGRTDVITACWFAKQIAWIRNTGQSDLPFQEIPIGETGNNETAITADINNDGQPDVIPNTVKDRAAWYEFQRDPDESTGVRWIRHELPAEVASPGVGAGDINGDGRCDIVGAKGWAEQPADADADWTFHPEFELEDPGIPIIINDVDGDGDADIVWGIGHNYGVLWLEQECDVLGKRVWAKHEIDKSWSQAHVVLAGDIDGDGVNEFVTGKRWHAHNGRDPGGNEPRCLYWYDYDRNEQRWTRHAIEENGSAGTGTGAEMVDIDRDGDLDLIMPGKSGLYLFENLLKP